MVPKGYVSLPFEGTRDFLKKVPFERINGSHGFPTQPQFQRIEESSMGQLTELRSERQLPEKYRSIRENIKTPDRKVRFVMYLFADGPKEYDFLLKVMSLGRDRYWRTTTVTKAAPKVGDRALDIACGTGLISFELAGQGAQVVGLDVTREMVLQANVLKKNYERQFSRKLDVEFVQARAENMPFRSDTFNFSTMGLAMRNVSSIKGTIEEMTRCVATGGEVMSMDFTLPKGGFFRSFYSFYIFWVLPTIGYVVSRHWNGILSYLAGSIKRSKTPEQISEVMRSCGLSPVTIKRMTLGVTALVSGKKEDS